MTQQPAATPKPPAARPPRRSSRGKWTIAAMFALGLAVLGGLFLAPRNKPPAAPPGVPWGVPDGPLRVVFYDARPAADGPGRTADEIAADVRRLSDPPSALPPAAADYVLVVNLDPDAVLDLAAALGMQQSYHPSLFHRLPPGRRGQAGGVCILSRHPLYEAAPLRSAGETFGVSAVSVVGGRKFMLVCANLPALDVVRRDALTAAWKQAGAPPAVVGGGSGGLSGFVCVDSSEDVRLPGTPVPAGPPAVDVEMRRTKYGIYSSPGWTEKAFGLWPTDGRDESMVWADLTGGRPRPADIRPGATTGPSTRPTG